MSLAEATSFLEINAANEMGPVQGQKRVQIKAREPNFFLPDLAKFRISITSREKNIWKSCLENSLRKKYCKLINDK